MGMGVGVLLGQKKSFICSLLFLSQHPLEGGSVTVGLFRILYPDSEGMKGSLNNGF